MKSGHTNGHIKTSQYCPQNNSKPRDYSVLLRISLYYTSVVNIPSVHAGMTSFTRWGGNNHS